MATLSVWKFPHAANAEQTLAVLEDLEKQQLLKLHDGAVVTWQPGDKKPRTRSCTPPRRPGRWAAPSGACCSG